MNPATHRVVPIQPDDQDVEMVAATLGVQRGKHPWHSLTETERDALRDDVRFVYAMMIGDFP